LLARRPGHSQKFITGSAAKTLHLLLDGRAKEPEIYL